MARDALRTMSQTCTVEGCIESPLFWSTLCEVHHWEDVLTCQAAVTQTKKTYPYNILPPKEVWVASCSCGWSEGTAHSRFEDAKIAAQEHAMDNGGRASVTILTETAQR